MLDLSKLTLYETEHKVNEDFDFFLSIFKLLVFIISKTFLNSISGYSYFMISTAFYAAFSSSHNNGVVYAIAFLSTHCFHNLH